MNLDGIHVTAQLFLLTQFMYKYIGYLNIHGSYMTANNSVNNKAVFFFCF